MFERLVLPPALRSADVRLDEQTSLELDLPPRAAIGTPQRSRRLLAIRQRCLVIVAQLERHIAGYDEAAGFLQGEAPVKGRQRSRRSRGKQHARIVGVG